MAGYVEIHGHPTWIHRTARGGAGHETRRDTSSETAETVLLLHGGLSCSDELLAALEEPLSSAYAVVAFDRKGHGYTGDTDEAFHYDAMAEEVIGVIEHLGTPVHLVGWSDGGIAALLASRRRPDLVRRQVLIGANFHHDGIVIGDLDEDGDAALSGQMAQTYAQRSPDGIGHFPVVYAKFVAMARTEPTLTVADLGSVATPTLVLAGDDDMVSLEHTTALYLGLPQAQLAIVPGASHAVPVEKPDLVARLILDFLRGPVPPQTALPVRRAESVDLGPSGD
jgi:pimeloyl-ACP methyl ester carboxylesterase